MNHGFPCKCGRHYQTTEALEVCRERDAALNRIRERWPHIEIGMGKGRPVVDPGPMTCLRCAIERSIEADR